MTSLRQRTNSDRDKEFRSVLSDDSIEINRTYKIDNQVHSQPTKMACRDRTNEFKSVVKNKEERGMDLGPLKRAKRGSMESWTKFMESASLIGKDITNTYRKLEKLTLLAKGRSLFHDKQIEVKELTYIIKEDINSLNKQIANLQNVTKLQRAKHGNQKLSHTNSVVVSLQMKLANMSNDFRGVLELRTQNLQHEKYRREEFSSQSTNVSGATLPAALSENAKSVLLSDEERKGVNVPSDGDYFIDMNGGHFQQQVQLIDEQDSFLQNRADTMENIESTIVELGTIFQQLAVMVKEQEETVKRIDTNVEFSNLNIEAAHSEILTYFRNVTSNRWLMIKVFGILIVFFIIFVVLIA